MQFPESWLREFCDPPLSTQALADLLTMSGMEVEELRPVAPPFSGVVVATIVECAPHPNADRLRVCKVDAGPHSASGLLQIVCGAPNARAGLRVPLALVGARLPDIVSDDGSSKPFAITQSKLRGVESQGMLCSARELKLSADHAGLLELADDAPAGADLRAWLRLDDTLFVLKLTPNLAHGLSVYGVAREVAALTGAPLRTPAIAPVAPSSDDRLAVQIDAPELCGRFSGRVVRGVRPDAATPAWMVQRLERCGQRAVSPLVDISNYVMFEFGRPSHIFDRDKIHGGLTVRWARPGERLELLNGNTVELDGAVGVIADDQAVESLAGIMGGQATAVSQATRNIYIEAAFWWPQAVQGRSRRYNFSTDAGHRFERGVDPALTVAHIERITELVLQICGTPETRVGAIDDQTLRLPERTPVALRVQRAAKVIGTPLTVADVAAVFTRLGLAFSEAGGVFQVTPPSWRFDLAIEADLIEEVARVMGYEHLPDTPPLAPVVARVRSESQRSAHAVRRALAALGYQETINFSFVEERWERELAGNADPIRLLNPIAAPLAVMRSSLMGSLLAVLRHNLAHKAERVRVFEVGRVFRRDAQVADAETAVAGVHQPLHVAGLAWGPADALQWGLRERPSDFFDLKGDVQALLAPRALHFVAAGHPALHPGRSARVELEGRAIGFIGELHPRWRQAYELPQPPVLFELELEALLQQPLPQARPVPRLQSVWRDLAVIASDAVGHDTLVQAVHEGGGALVRSVRLFDLYKPEKPGAGMVAGERSLALRVELLDPNASLQEERIEATVSGILASLAARAGARLRT
jgi:phenylalanyl-tRNA synthetase beta chain